MTSTSDCENIYGIILFWPFILALVSEWTFSSRVLILIVLFAFLFCSHDLLYYTLKYISIVKAFILHRWNENTVDWLVIINMYSPGCFLFIFKYLNNLLKKDCALKNLIVYKNTFF